MLYDARNPNPVFCENLEGRDGVVGGREVQQGRDIFIPVAYSCYVWQKIIDYYKAVIPN